LHTTRRRHLHGCAPDRDPSPGDARGRPPDTSTAPAARNQATPRRIRRQRHQLDGTTDISSPVHGPHPGRDRPIARTGKRPAGRVRRMRRQDIWMNTDGPGIQDHSDARRLRSGGAPVRGEWRRRRQANRRRAPGDTRPVTTSTRPTLRRSPSVARLRSARTGSAPARPSPLARVGRRVTGTSSRSMVTIWLGCARASATTSAISCRLAGSWGSGLGPCRWARGQERINRSRMRAIPRSAVSRSHANGLRMASRV